MSARRAGGPQTPEGKAKAARNALRHGCRSAVAVLPGQEAPAAWERHRQGIMAALAPVGALEEALAERCALLLWRLARVARYERDLLLLGLVDAEQAAVRAAYRVLRREPPPYRQSLAALHEEAECNQEEPRLLAAALSWPPERAVACEEADGLLLAVANARPDLDGEALPEPGCDWTWAELRARLEAWAGEPTESLLAAAAAHAHRERLLWLLAEQAAEETYARHTHAALLPPEKDAEKVCRYEAHLHRQFTSTLHELEALQARRQGQAAPLARVDVAGLPGN